MGGGKGERDGWMDLRGFRVGLDIVQIRGETCGMVRGICEAIERG